MMLDIFELEVVVLESYESLCFGVCILGLYVIGKIDLFDVVFDMVGSMYSYMLIEDLVKEYRKLILIFINLLRLLEN